MNNENQVHGILVPKPTLGPILIQSAEGEIFFDFPVLHKVYFPLIAIKKLF